MSLKFIFCLFRFWYKIFRLFRFWNKISKVSDFKTNFWTRVRFWIEYFTAHQVLSVLLLQLARFLCVHHNRARFGNVFLYGVGSVSQFILLGWNLCTPTAINVTIHIKTVNLIRVCSSIYLSRKWYLTRFY